MSTSYVCIFYLHAHYVVRCDLFLSSRSLNSTAASIWFEIWRVVDPGKKNSIFLENFRKMTIVQAISQKNRFFRANLRTISIFFSCNFTKDSDFQGKFLKNFDF